MTIEHLLIALLILCVIAFVGAMLRPDKATPEPRGIPKAPEPTGAGLADARQSSDDEYETRQIGVNRFETKPKGLHIGRPSKGRQIERQIHTCIKDHGVVPIEAKFMVPLGYEVEHVGNAQGDVNWNNGQGYIVVKLSVTKAGEAP